MQTSQDEADRSAFMQNSVFDGNDTKSNMTNSIHMDLLSPNTTATFNSPKPAHTRNRTAATVHFKTQDTKLEDSANSEINLINRVQMYQIA